MDKAKATEFLVQNRTRLGGERLLNSPERWYFATENLPPEIGALVKPGHSGLILSENPNDTWNVRL